MLIGGSGILCFPDANYEHGQKNGSDGLCRDLGMQRSGWLALSFVARFGSFVGQQGFDLVHLFFHLLFE